MKNIKYLLVLLAIAPTICFGKFPFKVEAFLFNPLKGEGKSKAYMHETQALVLVDELRGFFNNPTYFDQNSPNRIVVEGRFKAMNYSGLHKNKGKEFINTRFRFVSLDGKVDFRKKIDSYGTAVKTGFNFARAEDLYFKRTEATQNFPVLLTEIISNEFIPFMKKAQKKAVTRSDSEMAAYLIKARTIENGQVQSQVAQFDKWNKYIKEERIKKKLKKEKAASQSKFFGSLAKGVLGAFVGGGGMGSLGGGAASGLVKSGSSVGKVGNILTKSYGLVQKMPQAQKSRATTTRPAYKQAQAPAPLPKIHTHSGGGLPGFGDSETEDPEVTENPLRMICVVQGACGDYLFKNVNDKRKLMKKCRQVVKTKCKAGPACEHTTPKRRVISYTYSYGVAKTKAHCLSTGGAYLGDNYYDD
jgi:hypothetical protein